LRLASLAVLIATIYRIVTCTDKETTCNVGQGSCDELRVSTRKRVASKLRILVNENIMQINQSYDNEHGERI
jgi:hypothetical protein